MRVKIVVSRLAFVSGFVFAFAHHAHATDLKIKKTALTQTVMVGDTVRFEIIVDNTSVFGGGPFDSPNTQFSDMMPPELQFVSGEGDNTECSLGESNTVTCTVGEVKKGTTRKVIITVIALAPGVVTNEAQVKGDLFDPDPNNNTDSATITIEEFAGAPDIEVKKTASAAGVLVGDTLIWHITVTNLALDPAPNVVLTDNIGPDVNFLGATGASCTGPFEEVTCNLGEILGGGKVEIDLAVQVIKVGPIANSASATTTANDINLGNNSSEVVHVEVVPYLVLLTELAVADDCYPEVNPETDGTTDGNRNTFTVTVMNYTPDEKQVEVRFLDKETGRLLPAGTGVITFSVPAGESRTSDYTWNTTGFAWNDDESQHPDPRQIRVELMVDGADSGHRETEILVRPKPIILVHGLWSNAASWDTYPAIAVQQHANWDKRVIPVTGIDTGLIPSAAFLEPTAMHQTFTKTTIQQNAGAIKSTIEAVKAATKSCHVDLVAHSMGGLMSRDFIHRTMPAAEKDGERLVRHLVQLGTPNEGSPCADDIMAAYPSLYDPNGANLGSVFQQTRPPNNIIELTTTHVQGAFNKAITNQKGVPFHIMAGSLLPFTCRALEAGDGVVTLSSAYGSTANVPVFTSTGVRRIIHTGMTADAEIFNNFVKPILAEPPGSTTGKNAIVPAVEVSDRPVAAKNQASGTPQYILTGTYDVLKDVAAVEIPIAVPEASSFGVTYFTASDVRSTLFDPSGAPVDTIEAGSARAEASLRSHEIESPEIGTWKLELEQGVVDTARALVSAWVEGASLELSVDVGEVQTDDHIKVTGSLTDADFPVAGATLQALALGEPRAVSFMLFDDGAHADGAADDGVYAGWFRPRQDGTYLVSVTATTDAGAARVAVMPVEVENVTPLSTERLEAAIPAQHRLEQNYPNPFNPSTTIRFAVSTRQHVTLEVFDLAGKVAATLINKDLKPGEYGVTFDATGLPSGTYFYRLRAGAFQSVKRMTLLK